MTEPGAAAPGLAPGDVARVAFAKWDRSPHWSADVVWLGEDAHGWWAGWPDGTRWTRPGADLVSHGLQVGLWSRDRGFAATFHEQVADHRYRLYVDVTTVPSVSPSGVVEAVDLDLDVIQEFDGSVFVDDEDEFELHRAGLAYPEWLVAHAQAECRRLVDEVRSGADHFAESLAEHWRSQLRSLLDS